MPSEQSIAMFWKWFSENEQQLYNVEYPHNLFDFLQSKLDSIADYLTWEFSGVDSDGKRQFVISADGVASMFPLVFQIVQQAPVLQKFEVVALRQPHKSTSLQCYGRDIDKNNVYYSAQSNEGRLDITLYFEDYDGSENWLGVAFLTLDTVIGEYLTATVIGEIQLGSIYARTKDSAPIRALPNIVDGFRNLN